MKQGCLHGAHAFLCLTAAGSVGQLTALPANLPPCSPDSAQTLLGLTEDQFDSEVFSSPLPLRMKPVAQEPPCNQFRYLSMTPNPEQSPLVFLGLCHQEFMQNTVHPVWQTNLQPPSSRALEPIHQRLESQTVSGVLISLTISRSPRGNTLKNQTPWPCP